MSESWVRADLRRLHSKHQSALERVFSPIDIGDGPAAADNQTTQYDRLMAPVQEWDATPEEAPVAAAPVTEGFFEDAVALMQRDPRPRWLVQGLIEQDCLAVISGAPGTYKSFLILDVAFAMATGNLWHGRRTQQAPVLLIAGEGHGGLSRRMRAWFKASEADPSTAQLAVSRCAAQMLDDASYAMVEREAKAKAREWGRAPGMIVIDTLNRNFGPGDENSTGDMSNFFARCDRLRQVFPKSTVVVVHHAGHGDQRRSRGSSVVSGTADVEIVLLRERDPATNRPEPGAQVTFRKMKDAEEPESFWIDPTFVHLGLDEVGDDYGSLVISRLSATPITRNIAALNDPEFQADIDRVLNVHREGLRISNTDAARGANLSVIRLREVREQCVTLGLLKTVGHTRAARFELTVTGAARVASFDEAGIGDLNVDDEIDHAQELPPAAAAVADLNAAERAAAADLYG
jgi:hypothetical protein